MYVCVNQSFEVYSDGDFDVDPEDFYAYIDNREPTIELLHRYLDDKLEISCEPPEDLQITDIYLTSRKLSDYEELFEEVRRIQAEEED